MSLRKRFIIISVGLILLFIVSAINSITGNPISKFLAKRAAGDYIEDKYSDLDLEMKEVYYNFKFKTYGVNVQSKTSEDTSFTIYIDGLGNIDYDDYEHRVTNNFNTWNRLNMEIDERADQLIREELDYVFDKVFIQFIETSKNNQDLLKLRKDMKLDISSPPLPLEAYIVVFAEEVSYAKIAEVAKAIEKVLENHNIPIDTYSVRLIPLSDKPKNEEKGVSWVNSLVVNDFPKELMSERNLPKVMEDFELKNSLE